MSFKSSRFLVKLFKFCSFWLFFCSISLISFFNTEIASSSTFLLFCNSTNFSLSSFNLSSKSPKVFLLFSILDFELFILSFIREICESFWFITSFIESIYSLSLDIFSSSFSISSLANSTFLSIFSLNTSFSFNSFASIVFCFVISDNSLSIFLISLI